MKYEDELRSSMIIPIRILGKGSFGCVLLGFRPQESVIAVKVIHKERYNPNELDAAIELTKKFVCPYIVRFSGYVIREHSMILQMQYANISTLEIIPNNKEFCLPSFTQRALMKQILEGMKAFHSTGLVHRDIKCDNILLHSTSGTMFVHAKISDFGLAKKENQINEKNYIVGTLPFMAPELFKHPLTKSQKVDIYSLGVVFYRIVTCNFPIVLQEDIDTHKMILLDIPKFEKPLEIKDNTQWDLLSQMLEFDPDKRITAAEALQHPYFTSSEALADISQDQKTLARMASEAKQNGETRITDYDVNPSFIVAEHIIRKFMPTNISEVKYSLHLKNSQQFIENSNNQNSQDQLTGELEEKELVEKQKQTQEMKELEKENNHNDNNYLEQLKLSQADHQQLQVQDQMNESIYGSIQLQQIPQINSSSQKYQTFQQTQQSSHQSDQQSIQNQQIYDNNTNKKQIQIKTQLKKFHQASYDELRIENGFYYLNMKIETIKQQLEKFETLSLIQKDLLSMNILYKLCNNNAQHYNIYINDMIQLCKKLLNSEQENILWKQLIILLIIIETVTQNDGKRNILLEDMIKNQIIDQLFEIFLHNQYEDKRICNYSAMAIGYLFKAAPIPTQIGLEIINHLKTQAICINSDFIVQSNATLSFLAECNENHQLIFENVFLNNINQLIEDDKNSQFYLLDNTLVLLMRFFKFGNEQSKQQINIEINTNRIKILSHKKYGNTSNYANKLLKLICEENMTEEEKLKMKKQIERMETIIEQVNNKNEQERMKLIVDEGILNEICEMIEDELKEEINWCKQYLFQRICYATSLLLYDNKSISSNSLQQNRIIESLISLLEKLPIELIFPHHILPLKQNIYHSNNEQRKLFINERILNIFGKIIYSKDEEVIFNALISLLIIIFFFGYHQNEIIQHPKLEMLKQNGMLDKLNEMTKNNQCSDKNIHIYSAISILYLFKATKLPTEFEHALISTKHQLQNSDQFIINNSLVSIANLAECNENHNLILSDSLISDINLILLNNKRHDIIENVFSLLLTIYQFGSTETKQYMNQYISTNQMIQLSHEQNKIIEMQINLLLKLMCEENMNEQQKLKLKIQLNKTQQIIQKVYNKNENERIKMIINDGTLNEICDLLEDGLNGQIDWCKQYFLQKVCEVAFLLLKESRQVIQYAIQQERIIDLLISLLNKLPLNSIFPHHIMPLTQIIYYTNNDQRKKLIGKQIMQVLEKTVYTENEEILYNSVLQISIMLNVYCNLQQTGEQNLQLEEMKQNGILNKLNQILNNVNIKDEIIKIYSAISILYLFKATKLPTEFEHALISTKHQLQNSDQFIINNSLVSIANLAECNENHNLILSDSLISDINQILLNKLEVYNIILNTIQLIIILFQSGSIETRKMINKQIQLNLIQKIAHQSNRIIQSFINKLLKLICEENMTEEEKLKIKKQIERMETIIEQVNNKNEQERMKLIVDEGILNEICEMIEDELKEEINWCKQYLFQRICYATSLLLYDNKSISSNSLQQNRIIESLISLLEKLPIELIFPHHILPLRLIITQSANEQIQVILNKGLIIALQKPLNSYDEVIVFNSVEIIRYIVFSFALISKEGQQNKMLEVFEVGEILLRIIQIFRNDFYENKNIKRLSSCAIGCIYKAVYIPNEFGQEIISYLKLKSQDSVWINSSDSFFTLGNLAECQENHQLIQSEQFMSIVNKLFINTEQSQQLQNILAFIIRMIRSGTTQTKILINKEISSEHIKSLIQNQNIQLSNTASTLSQLMNKIQQQIQNQVKYNISKITLPMERLKDQMKIALEDMTEEQMLQKAIHDSLLPEIIQERKDSPTNTTFSINYTDPPSQIIYVLKQICNQIYNSNTKYQNIEISTQFIFQLVILRQYKLGSHVTLQEDNESIQIRSLCRQCLKYIHLKGDVIVQSYFLLLKYIRVLVMAISICGGHGEDNDTELNSTLLDLVHFISELRLGRESQNSYFSPQPFLLKEIEEQIEEESGLEEIEAQMVNQGNVYDDVQDNACKVVREIMNCFYCLDNKNE